MNLFHQGYLFIRACGITLQPSLAFLGFFAVLASALALEEPPQILFSGPRVIHSAYSCTRSNETLLALELQFKRPDGGVQVLMSGTKFITGTNRLDVGQSGTYELILHEVLPTKPQVTHRYTSLATYAIDNKVPQPIRGRPEWSEVFDTELVSQIEVDLPGTLTLDLRNLQVESTTLIKGTNTHGAVWISEGKYLGPMTIEVGELRMESCEVESAGLAGWTKVSLRNVKAKGSLGAGGSTNNTVLVQKCESSDLTLFGGMVLVDGCKMQTRLQADVRHLAVSGSYCGGPLESRCTATEVLRLDGNDFYGGVGVTVPSSGLYLVNNVFLGQVTCTWLGATMNGSLAISGNSFWAQTALTLPPPVGFETYQVNGNFWGDPAGPTLGGRPLGGNWQGPAGGSCSFMAEDTTWTTFGRRKVTGLGDTYAPTNFWVQGVAIGQGVLSPDYVPLLLKGRRTLVSFDLRVPMGEMSLDKVSFYATGADGQRRMIPPRGLSTVRRFYPPEAPVRTVDFIVPAHTDDMVAFTLAQRDEAGVENNVFFGTYRFQDPSPRPLRIGLKLMTVNAWGYPREFNQAPRPDQDTSTVIQDRLTTAMAALLPLRKRQDMRIEMLASAEHSPLLTGFLPQRHNSIYFGLARYLQEEFNNENARRNATGRQPLDLMLAVVPQGALSSFTGATGFNHPWYPRIAVIEESDPEAAIHEFGHALGLYAREQYNLPEGWNEAAGCDPWNADTMYICDIYVDADAGARFWGASLFVADESLTFPSVPGGILHCRAGRESGLRDIMGATAADVMVPSTHSAFTARLRNLLGWEIPAMSASLAGASADAPAPGKRRIVMEADFVSQNTNAPQPFYPQLVPETLACRVAPPGLPEYPGTERLYQRLRVFNSAGALLDTFELRRSSTVPEGVFRWRQTFDVPENAVRYELETSSHTAEFLWPLPGDWQPQLSLTHGLLAGGNIVGPYVDFSFGVAQAGDAPRRLGITLLVSDDGATTWKPLGDYDGLSSARVWRDGLPVSDDLRFKVIVSDGFQSRESVLGPYRRLESAAAVSILSPWAEAVAPEGTAWTLAAAVSSVTEPASVRWSSSLDGDLGANQRLESIQLSPGRHVLTCVAMDSGGRASSNSVSVLVAPADRKVVDLEVREDGLTLGVENWDPVRGRVQRPQTGKRCDVSVRVHNPGVTNTMRLRLYSVLPGGQELLLSDQAVEAAPLETATITGAFTPVEKGIYRLRAEASLLTPEELSETNLSNNQWTWSFTNKQPVALGSLFRISAGQTTPVELGGLDEDGDDLGWEVVKGPIHGQLTGVPPVLTYVATTNHTGVDSLTFRVFDGLAWSAAAEVSFQIRKAPPSLPRQMTVVAQAGKPFYYQIPAVGQDLGFRYSMLPMLFSDLKWDAKTGVVTGSPVVGHQNADVVQVTNSAGLAQGLLSITILTNALPPEITSASVVSAMAGGSFSYQITALNVAQSYLAKNLPAGVFFSEFQGLVSGVPLNAGDFTFSVGASNSFGVTWKDVELRVQSSGQPPNFIRLLDSFAVLGSPFTHSLAQFCGNNPTDWQITGLPPGLVMSAGGGLVTGIPQVAGYYSPTVTARNVAGEAIVTFSLLVQTPPGVPVVVNPGELSMTVGTTFTFQIQASESPSRFGVQGLPPGLTVDTGTGKISGKPAGAGRYSLILSATNAKGQGAIEVPMLVMPNPNGPLVGDAVLSDLKIGDSVDYVPVVFNNPTSFSASGLPKGVILNPITGRLTGRVEGTGRYVAILSGSNALGVGEAKLYFTVAPDFAGWLSVSGLSGASLDPEADPDQDGYSNLAEYALGGGADAAEAVPLVRLNQSAESGVVLLFRVWSGGEGNLLSDYRAGGVRYEVETATSVLGPWEKDANAFSPDAKLTDQPDGTRLLAVPFRNQGDNPMRFVRIRVTQL